VPTIPLRNLFQDGLYRRPSGYRNQLKIDVNILAHTLKHNVGIPEPIQGAPNVNSLTSWGMSGVKYMILNSSSLNVSLRSAKSANIPPENIIVIGDSLESQIGNNGLIRREATLLSVERAIFAAGEAKRRLAFLLFLRGRPDCRK